jgi:hypothetical protein
MKVMFIASNSRESDEGSEGRLNLVRDVTELQRCFSELGPIEFAFLPHLKVEELPRVLSEFKPDILHLSSHGKSNWLVFANERNQDVKMTAAALASFMPTPAPRLVYLNACDSLHIAKELVKLGTVPMAIGMSAPITNGSARASAVAFYQKLLLGESVQRAFKPAHAMLTVMNAANVKCDAELCSAQGIDTASEVLHRVPRLIASFWEGVIEPDEDEHFNLRLGVEGCPVGTVQIVFFTDDPSFLTNDEEYEEELCLVERSVPVRGVIWADEGRWRSEGDHRLCAVGLKAERGWFALEATLCDAIENYYRRADGRMSAPVESAVRKLKRLSGVEPNPNLGRQRASRSNSRKKKRT